MIVVNEGTMTIAFRQRLAALSILVLVATAAPSWAALGRRVESVAVDQQRLQGERRSVAGEGFQVEEIASADGTLVREYVSPTGEIFGVSWRGLAVPDLALLLGDYLAEFRGAARSTTRRHRPLVVRTERLVVEMGGHVRAFHGRAYLPGALPDTVPQEVVR
jgi:hypothetical protein